MSWHYPEPQPVVLTDDQRNQLAELAHEGQVFCDACETWVDDDDDIVTNDAEGLAFCGDCSATAWQSEPLGFFESAADRRREVRGEL